MMTFRIAKLLGAQALPERPEGSGGTQAGDDRAVGDGRAVVAGLVMAVAAAMIAAVATLVMGGSFLTALLVYSATGIVTFLIVAGFVGRSARTAVGLIADGPVRAATTAGLGLIHGIDARTGKPFPVTAHRSNPNSTSYAGHVFCAGSCEPGDATEIADFLAEQDYCVDLCDDLGATLAAVSAAPQHCALLVVDLDHFEPASDLNSLIDEISAFRHRVPGVPVVILSRAFARDELGTHRLEIADASLRSPATQQRLVDALIAAWSNNGQWRERVRGRVA